MVRTAYFKGTGRQVHVSVHPSRHNVAGSSEDLWKVIYVVRNPKDGLAGTRASCCNRALSGPGLCWAVSSSRARRMH